MLSIITINYNNVVGLQKTLESVQQQAPHGSLQHIIVDGASDDGSVQVIKNYALKSDNATWLSEVDDGIYHAMNKGLELVSGSHVAFLNSGDVIQGSDKLNLITSVLKDDPSIDLLYSDLEIKRSDGTVVRRWISGPFTKKKLYFGWMPPHPMTTVRVIHMLKAGKFNSDYKIAGDYDLMLKVLLKNDINVRYISKTIVSMEAGGVSNSSVIQIIKSNFEVLKSWIAIKGFLAPYWIFFTKPFSKLLQIKSRF